MVNHAEVRAAILSLPLGVSSSSDLMKGINVTPAMNRAADVAFRNMRRTTLSAAMVQSSGSMMSMATAMLEKQQNSPQSPERSKEGFAQVGMASYDMILAQEDSDKEFSGPPAATAAYQRNEAPVEGAGLMYGLQLDQIGVSQERKNSSLHSSLQESPKELSGNAATVGSYQSAMDPALLGSYKAAFEPSASKTDQPSLGSYKSTIEQPNLGSYQAAMGAETPSLVKSNTVASLYENSEEESSEMLPAVSAPPKEMDLNELYQTSLERLNKVVEG